MKSICRLEWQRGPTRLTFKFTKIPLQRLASLPPPPLLGFLKMFRRASAPGHVCLPKPVFICLYVSWRVRVVGRSTWDTHCHDRKGVTEKCIKFVSFYAWLRGWRIKRPKSKSEHALKTSLDASKLPSAFPFLWYLTANGQANEHVVPIVFQHLDFRYPIISNLFQVRGVVFELIWRSEQKKCCILPVPTPKPLALLHLHLSVHLSLRTKVEKQQTDTRRCFEGMPTWKHDGGDDTHNAPNAPWHT